MTIDDSALSSLAAAYGQCIQRMEGIKGRPDALRFLVAIRQTLLNADGFRRELRRVLAIGDPGPTITAELDKLEAESAAIATEIAQLETSLAEIEKATQARDAELEKLKTHKQRETELRHALAELEQLDALATKNERLREHVTELEARVNMTETRQLLTLLNELAPLALQRSGEHELTLGRHLEQTLARLDDSELKLRQMDNELQRAYQRWSEAGVALSAERSVLETYARADRAIAEAMPGAANAQEALNHVSRQLEEIDLALRAAIEVNGRSVVQRLKPVGFKGAPLHPESSSGAQGGASHGAL